MKKLVPILILTCLFFNKSHASHIMGGEITWECLSNGKFVFTMTIYRDCKGIGQNISGEVLGVYYHPQIHSIPLNFVSPSKDISPVCNNPILQANCGVQLPQGNFQGQGNVTNINGAVEELIFKSDTIALQGIPGPQGWLFAWNSCCRNNAISNLSNLGTGYTLRAKMFNYTENGASKNMYPCFDSSPHFAARPVTVLCTGYPFTYSENAYDNELDSLAYSWAQPLNDDIDWGSGYVNLPTNLVFSAGFSYTSPFPDTTLNSNNVPAILNSTTGEISYTSFNQGNYVAVVKAQAFKNGQLIAEIFRDFQHVMLPCGLANFPPVVAPPFYAATSFDTTITVGSMLSFKLMATDIGTIPGTTVVPQSVAIFASGSEFDPSDFLATSTNCSKPPCAGLTPAPGSFTPTTSEMQFNWQTTCAHLQSTSGESLSSKTYSFIFSAQDDYCPAPSIQTKMVNITIQDVPPLAAPQLKSTSITSNGSWKVKWYLPNDPAATFNSYLIYAAPTQYGSYTVIDSILSYTSDSVEIPNTFINSGTVYFYMNSRSGCYGQRLSTSSDTSFVICTMDAPKLKSTRVNTNGDVVLKWYTPLDYSGAFSAYLIYASTSIQGPYSLMDSITNYASDSALILNTTANINPVYFYIITRSSCGFAQYSGSSDTLSTISTAARYLGSNKTLITWNKPSIVSTSDFKIYRQQNNSWIFLTSLSDTSYIDSLTGCNLHLNYKIAYADQFGNQSSSSASAVTVSPFVIIHAIKGSPDYINDGYIDIEIDGGTAPYQYKWSNHTTNKNVSNLAIGSYSLTVTDANGCSFSKENIEIKNEIDPTSKYEQNGFILTPNPASDKFIIVAVMDAELIISNSSGEQVLVAKIQKGTTNFSTEKLANGSYTVLLNSDQKRKTYNLVVIH